MAPLMDVSKLAAFFCSSVRALNSDMPVEDRILAVMITDEMKDKEQVELEDFN